MADEIYLNKLLNDIYKSTTKTIGDMEPGKIQDLEAIKEIVKPLLEMIDEAKQKKMYIFFEYDNKWINPYEYENKLAEGRYLYDTGCLKLRNPEELIEELEKELIDKRKHIKRVLGEISTYTGINEADLEISALKKVMIKEKVGERII